MLPRLDALGTHIHRVGRKGACRDYLPCGVLVVSDKLARLDVPSAHPCVTQLLRCYRVFHRPSQERMCAFFPAAFTLHAFLLPFLCLFNGGCAVRMQAAPAIGRASR